MRPFPRGNFGLVIEMTESVTMLLPMLGASFVRHRLVPTLLRDPPIYDSCASTRFDVILQRRTRD
jgi:H+/Cl- antiporter ClcA